MLAKANCDPQRRKRVMTHECSHESAHPSAHMSAHASVSNLATLHRSFESPVFSYRVHLCAMGFDGPPTDGFPHLKMGHPAAKGVQSGKKSLAKKVTKQVTEHQRK